MTFIRTISELLITFAQNTGYWGFFVAMILESTSIPIILPAEIVLVSAGYLVGLGELNFYITTLVCTVGSMVGASINYFLAFFFGRKLIEKYGKYVFISKKKFAKFEALFARRSGLFTFVGRFIPLVKHIASIPPGLSKMNFFRFSFYTSLGSFLFNITMIYIGMEIGENVNDKSLVRYLEIGAVVFVVIIFAVYYLYNRFASREMKRG